MPSPSDSRTPIRPEEICVIANPKSGRNSRDKAAIDRAMAVLGPGARLRRWSAEGGLEDEVKQAVAEGYKIVVAAGGDGTVTGVAQALIGTGVPMGVLPLGTFNYFARGLGLPQEPEAAASAILNGTPHRISVGVVNGQVFLNNASLGLYPTALRERETAYKRWGRSRLMAHVALLRTLYRFQRPHRLTIETDDGATLTLRTPLVFAARSAYQVDYFGLDGRDAISADQFAVYIARDGSRWHLFRMALRLATGSMKAGRDIDLITPRQMRIATRASQPYVAYDGEKRRMPAPLDFKILDDALAIIRPDPADRIAA